MENLKRKLSMVLIVMIISIAVFPLMVVNAASQVSMTVKMGSTTLSANNTYSVEGGETITATASAPAGIAFIGYKFVTNGVETPIVDVYSNTLTITVPEKPSDSNIRELRIDAVAKNDSGDPYDLTTKTGWVRFYLDYGSDSVSEDKEVSVEMGNKTLKVDGTVEAEVGTKLILSAEPADDVLKVYYSWDKGTAYEFLTASDDITIPTTFEPGSTHTLYVSARYSDGTVLDWAKYIFVIPEENHELDLPNYLKENDTVDGLVVSLRTDSEEDKANYNIYSLNEEVIYYLDYKNGGKDITSDVKLVLNIPLDYTIVESDGGVVSGDTITWNFANGLEADVSGTKRVVLKYDDLSKSKLDAEVIYPIADIYKGTKISDSSAVINYIFRDTETEIEETHYPYMFGDRNKDTFRPDDSISRAEAAIVLTRIFGIDITNAEITDRYTDIGTTYTEAQKAISAATYYGIINGYEESDGTFTYRPNAKIKRREFMTIIAKYIATIAEEDDIRGLEVEQDVLNEVGAYNGPVKKYADGSSITDFDWYTPYVTMLVRLNMTEVSEKDTDLRLSNEITRAEVAQLVNFALLRAPAEVTSKTTTQFSDVSRYHYLLGDIVEATRAAHTFTLTDEATEIAQ